MFDALCPPDSARPRKRLCVILVSQNTPYHDEPRKVLRQFAQDTTYSTERVRFMYIFKERQSDFVSALTTGKIICLPDFLLEYICSNKSHGLHHIV
jgi:DnaJ homolog subfamily C member 16